MEEIWKTIPGFALYEVSDLGNVRSFAGRRQTKKPRSLSLATDKRGYKFVNIKSDTGKQKTRRVHVLVALAFLGPRPEHKNVCHKNDIKDDNRLENLKYATQEENFEDARRNNGGVAPQASLKAEQVELIIEDLRTSSVTQVAEKYNISPEIINNIATGKSYVYIPRPDEELGQVNSKRERAEKIRSLYKTGEYAQQDLAEMFQMSISGICRIVNNQRASDNDPVYPHKSHTSRVDRTTKVIYLKSNDTILPWCNEQIEAKRYESFSALGRDALRCLSYFNEKFGDWRQVVED